MYLFGVLYFYIAPSKINKFEITPRNANETGNVTIECTASGNPTPVVTIINPNGMNVSHKMGRTELINVHRNQSGFYACTAENRIQLPDSARMELIVACMYDNF